MKPSSRSPFRFLGFLLLNCLLATPAILSAAERPNLIAICTDDQGRWGMGAYGNPEIHTPNMDRIAAEGALFINAFCNTPVCSPSRATYLSGRYPTEVGITDWINPDEARNGLGLAQPTWPQALQEAGYATAMIGKWHLGEQPQFHPTKLGFDHFTGFLSGGTKPMDPTLEIAGKSTKLTGPLPDILTTDAIDWIKSTQAAGDASKKKSFALCLHFRAPHTPYGPVPDEDMAHYKDLDPQHIPRLEGLDEEYTKAQHIAYYASISSVDRNIGRLLQMLDETGLAENTVVIFTSDHGYNLGRHYISTKGNGYWLGGGPIPGAPKRPNMWDTSIRVPFAIRWPGVVKPGTRIEDMISFVDMYRSVLGILGVEIPATTSASVRGRDFSPLLRGETPAASEDIIFGQYDLHNSGLAYLRMARDANWKYVRHYHENMQDELYDLQSDPDEAKNLFRRGEPATPEAKAAHERLSQALDAWMKELNDPLLSDSY